MIDALKIDFINNDDIVSLLMLISQEIQYVNFLKFISQFYYITIFRPLLQIPTYSYI